MGQYFSGRDIYGAMPYTTTGEQTIPEHAEGLAYYTQGAGGKASQEIVTKESMLKTLAVIVGIIVVLGVLGVVK